MHRQTCDVICEKGALGKVYKRVGDSFYFKCTRCECKWSVYDPKEPNYYVAYPFQGDERKRYFLDPQ